MNAVSARSRPAQRHAPPAGRGNWGVRLLRGRPDDPAWARPALLGLLLATAVLYLAGLSRNGYANEFYAAAVQAGTKSWKAFLFGSVDSSNFITVDKTPASLWVMELSARAFGFNYWSLLVPQALEGVAAVGVLYATVRRWFGPPAALIAGAVLAITPVATLMFRFDNPDALLVLVMTLAAYAVTRAIESGRARWLALAGALLGLGYLTKMLQAFLVLPAFGLAYVWTGPGTLARRLQGLLAGGAALVASAGWWVAIDLLTPAADRPYVGGSTDNNILQLTFGYNGLGRLTGSGNRGGGGGGGLFGGATGITRLLRSDMGGQISWLLPAALVALAALLWTSRRSPRADQTRAAALLWGGWLLVTGAVFSYMSGIIHPYYTVALAPPIGALVGIGAAGLWRTRHTWSARIILAGTLLVTAGWAWVLLGRSPGWFPWLRIVIAGAAIAAAGLILAGPLLRAATARGAQALAVAGISFALLAGLAGPLAYSIDTAATAHGGSIPTAGPAVTGSSGAPGGAGGPGDAGGPGSGSPAAAGRSGTSGFPGAPGRSGTSGSLGTDGRSGTSGSPGAGRQAEGARPGAGAFPGSAGRTPGGRSPSGETASPGGAAATRPGGTGSTSRALSRLLEAGAASYRWAAATVSSTAAASLELSSDGVPVMAIGGFTGSDPAPTLAEFEKLVSFHEIHYFVASGSGGGAGGAGGPGGGSGSAAQITAWVKAHFTAKTVGGMTVYDLTAPTAGS
jgi:4-amino-4-deoxy-L-arabinose transferase-like glycosyltransferase